MSLQKALAIVLKKSRAGEKDLVAHLLLDKGEKRLLRLHGILSSKNRSPLLAEPGALIEIDYYETQKEELSLREGVVIKRHDALKQSYVSQELLSKILLLGNLAGSGSDDPAAFLLVRSALEFADSLLTNAQPEKQQIEAFLAFLSVRTLDLMGLLGDMNHCAECDRPLTDRALFGEGAFFICEQCNPLADAVGYRCSQEIAAMQHRRYRDIRDGLETLDGALFEPLKNGLQRALRFTIPQQPEIFE